MSILLRCGLVLAVFSTVQANTVPPRIAVALLAPRNPLQSNQLLTGTVMFTETDDGLRITGNVAGLSAGKYKYQVHELGNIASCVTTGSQVSPAGDLGSTEFMAASGLGLLSIDLTESVLSLRGENSVLGRALVLHAEEDSAGLGEVGTRVACGVIGIMSSSDPWNSAVTSSASVLLFVAATILAYFRYQTI